MTPVATTCHPPRPAQRHPTTEPPLVRRLLEFAPTVVGRDGAWLLPVLVRQGLDLIDVEAALREHGLDDVKQMKLATLEADGAISIVATAAAEKSGIGRRRRRYHRPL